VLLDTRQRGDYTLEAPLDQTHARELIEQAGQLVGRVERYLREEGILR